MLRRIDGRDTYVGRLANDPRYLRDIAHGDEVRFEARHVIAISTEAEARMPPAVGVGLGVLRHDEWPVWAVRVAPAFDGDSGWRAFSDGDVRRDALRGASTDTIFRTWAVLDSVFAGDGAGAFRWNEGALEYERVNALPLPLARLAAAPLARPAAPPDATLRAVITTAALERAPLGAQHFESDRDGDSGWSFCVGDGQESFDEAGMKVVPLARVLHRYPYVEAVLRHPERTAWTWNDDVGGWIADAWTGDEE